MPVTPKISETQGNPGRQKRFPNFVQLAKENTPTRVIGLKLGRTEDAVRSKASEEGISLKPTNQSPYNRS
jgi:hypothetical protein